MGHRNVSLWAQDLPLKLGGFHWPWRQSVLWLKQVHGDLPTALHVRASDFFLFTVEGEGPLLLEKCEPGKHNVRSKEPLSSTDHIYNFTVCLCRPCHEVAYQMCLLNLSIMVLKKQLQTVTISYFPPCICIYALKQTCFSFPKILEST